MVRPPNARFWVWVNDGWVKLTLRPSQQLEWGTCHRCDEGWSSSASTWEHAGDPQGPDAISKATEEHFARLKLIDAAKDAIDEYVIAISDIP